MCGIARLSVIETLHRKEFYVVLVLVVGLAVWMQAMNIGSSAEGRFAKDIVMQVTWLASFALAVPLAVRQISSDLEQKTLYILASRPIHRWQYVAGRTVGASAASVACFLCLFLVLLAMLSIHGAANLADASLWQAFALQVLALVMLCSLTIMFSTVVTSGAAVTFSLITLLVMRYAGPSILHVIEGLPEAVGKALWFVYLMLPHFEFFNISQRVVHGWGALPIGLFLQVVAYGIVYAAVSVGVAALIFRRRWL